MADATTGGITYRAATADDCEALACLRWEMEAERHPDQVLPRAEYVAAYVAQTRDEIVRGNYRAWLAEADGEPISSALMIWWVMPPTAEQMQRRRGFVTSVYTRPAYRRRGIARRLMETLLEAARAEGVQRLILWASDMGRPLYEDLGFAPSRGLEWNG